MSNHNPARSPVQIQLVDNDNWEIVYTYVYPVNLINSENITAAPSTYVTPVYSPTSLAQTSVPSSASTITSSSQSHTSSTSSSISSTTSGSASNASPSATSSPEPSHSGMSTGAKVGVGVGAATAAILLIMLGFMLHKYQFRVTKRTNSQFAEPIVKPELESPEPQYQSYQMGHSQMVRPAYSPYQDTQAGVHELNTSY